MGGLYRADSWNVPLNGCGGAAQLRLLRQDTPNALFLGHALARDGSTGSGGSQDQAQQGSGGDSKTAAAERAASGALDRAGSLSSLMGTASGLARANSIGSPLAYLSRVHSGLTTLALPGVASSLQDDEYLGSPARSPAVGITLPITASPVKMVGSPFGAGATKRPEARSTAHGSYLAASTPSPAKRRNDPKRFEEAPGHSPVLIHLRNRGSVGRPSSPASPNLWNQFERRSPSVQILKSSSPSVPPMSDTKDPETDSAESLTDSIHARHGDQTDSLHAAESSRRPALSKHSPAPSGSPRPFPTLSHGRMVAGAKSKPSTSRLGRVDTPHPSNQTQSRSSKKRASPASSDGISKPHSGLGRKKLARKPCAYCGTTDTPQWRQGLNGERNLCNACGVKFRKGQLNHKRLVSGSAAP
mmetsp:Transcript_31558/g.81660  ORF Transcript_31558/g.81660 Transcript_31558/m.81660 type:complete len:415 (-) Transcript_31558:182-1426(-)